MKLKEKVQFKFAELYVNSLAKVERAIHGVTLNPLSSDLWEDPYQHHSKMRETHPIHYSFALKAFWVTRFDQVQEILLDKRFGANVREFEEKVARITKNMDAESREFFDNPSMLDLDPPDHSRIRRLVSQGFMHKFVQSLEPRIRHIVHECLQRHDNAANFDVVDVLAKPLPAVVIAEMLGLPEEDHDQFQAWSEDLIDGTATNDSTKLDAAQKANRQLVAYFRRIIKLKRQAPDEDLIGRLIMAEEAGDKLSETELYNTCLLLLIAGHETTTRLISNGLFLLLTHPDQLAKLRADKSLIPKAIEEMLRFEPPVQATRRFVLEDLEFHGTSFKRGQLVFLSIAGSNRDPRANELPDNFDIERDTMRQISFGYGIHLCIGASLARLEAKVTFEELLARYPHISLADDKPLWGKNAFFRGLEQLNVSVEV